MFCPGCGRRHRTRARYCRSCGWELSGKSKRESKPQRSARWKPLPFIGILLGVVIGLGLVNVGEYSKGAHRTPMRAETLYSAAVLEIASQFRCSCGSCGQKELETCTCEVATATKNLIRDELARGKPFNVIASIVDQQFGHREPVKGLGDG